MKGLLGRRAIAAIDGQSVYLGNHVRSAGVMTFRV